MRVISQPRYPSPVPPAQAIERLERATRTPHHAFWDCSISVLDSHVVDRTRIHGPKQVTDVYLLALSVANKGRFVTFDQSIPLSAIAGASESSLVCL